MPQTRALPNVSDPLSETTIGRRMWAAYLAKGFTPARFAREVGLRYQSLYRYETGEIRSPDIEVIRRASELLDYTIDQLVYGKSGPPRNRLESELSKDELKLLLNELRATPTELETFANFQESPAGSLVIYTRSYVSAWIAAFRDAIGAKRHVPERTLDIAIDVAKHAAADEQAALQAHGSFSAPPPTAEDLAALGRHISKNARPPVADKRNAKRKRA